MNHVSKVGSGDASHRPSGRVAAEFVVPLVNLIGAGYFDGEHGETGTNPRGS